MKLKPETRNLSKIPQKAGKPKNSVDLRQSQLSLTPAQREGPGFPFWNKNSFQPILYWLNPRMNVVVFFIKMFRVFSSAVFVGR